MGQRGACKQGTDSLVIKVAVAAQDLADDGTPGGDVSDVTLCVQRVEVQEDVVTQPTIAKENRSSVRFVLREIMRWLRTGRNARERLLCSSAGPSAGPRTCA